MAKIFPLIFRLIWNWEKIVTNFSQSLFRSSHRFEYYRPEKKCRLANWHFDSSLSADKRVNYGMRINFELLVEIVIAIVIAIKPKLRMSSPLLPMAVGAAVGVVASQSKANWNDYRMHKGWTIITSVNTPKCRSWMPFNKSTKIAQQSNTFDSVNDIQISNITYKNAPNQFKYSVKKIAITNGKSYVQIKSLTSICSRLQWLNSFCFFAHIIVPFKNIHIIWLRSARSLTFKSRLQVTCKTVALWLCPFQSDWI